MDSATKSNTAVVLDLDDTLYKEADYQTSGLEAVCACIKDLYGVSIRDALFDLKRIGESDLLGSACRIAGLPLSVKESLIWLYRLHEPRICLSHPIRNFLDRLQQVGHVAIITDGRSVSQRQKLRSLGLSHLPAYISEEYGADKPSPVRFELIMRELPASQYVFIGDNPRKDFLAPNKLGWITVGLRDDGRNIHRQDLTEWPAEQMPQKWINSLEDLFQCVAL